jgi:hypothetical protein
LTFFSIRTCHNWNENSTTSPISEANPMYDNSPIF